MNLDKDKYDVSDLKALMKRLRDKRNGCPWDIEQNFMSIKPHTIEEAYEVADAIENDDMAGLKDELGDLLFQVVFHAQMADEQDEFDFDDVINHVTKKMIFRHPHVFSDGHASGANDVEARIWERQKELERRLEKSNDENHYLDTLTRSLPALSLANKIQKQVHKVGFEFAHIDDVYDKLDEELTELKEACAHGNPEAVVDEMGDVLFCTALIAQTLGVKAEESLRQANLKFINRFNGVEDLLKSQGTNLESATLDDMSCAWRIVKTTDSQTP